MAIVFPNTYGSSVKRLRPESGPIMHASPPPSPPTVVEVTIHFDNFFIPLFKRDEADEKRSANANNHATVDAAGNIDLTNIYGPVVIYFRVNPADHHPFDRAGPLFTSDSPLQHTHRWRRDIQFQRVRLLDHGYTLRVDYHNVNKKHGRPMPANGYDLAFSGLDQGADPAIKNGSVSP
jgi:hypothetical protein